MQFFLGAADDILALVPEQIEEGVVHIEIAPFGFR